MVSDKEKRNYVPVIDLLRGLSCLGVLFYHLRVDLWIGWHEIQNNPEKYSEIIKITAWLSIPTPFLGYSILLFFLISGFCIHYPNSIKDYKINWMNYFLKRFFRIYPTYIAALIITSIISYYCKVKWNYYSWDPERILRVATLTQNYPPGNEPFWINPSLWTIPLEAEFYLLYPLVIIFFSCFKSLRFILLLISLCLLSIILYHNGNKWAIHTFMFFWPTWILGAWISKLYRKSYLERISNKLLITAISILLIISVISHLFDWYSWIQYFVWSFFYTSIFIFALKKSFINKINLINKLSTFLSFTGKISFSLYLIHFPLFKLFGLIHISYFEKKPENFLVSIIYLIPLFIIACFFYKLIEQPIHKFSRSLLK